VQSQNSGFTLRLGAEPASTSIALKGVLLSSVGLKYKSYCANIARTYIVDPTPQQEEIYTLLTEIQTEVLARMKEGAVAKDLYAHTLNMVKEKKPDLESHFVKNIGHAVRVVAMFMNDWVHSHCRWVWSSRNLRIL
jgi:nucleosome binding factor SPN SPT16 subunit